MHADDGSARNVVARNVIRTFGSECFDVKENAHDNVFEDNVCGGNTEPADHEGSNVELRGYANVVRNNQISDSAGVTMKITADGEKYDNGGNIVENNRISGSAAALMLDSAAAQGPMCGNVVRRPPSSSARRGQRRPPTSRRRAGSNTLRRMVSAQASLRSAAAPCSSRRASSPPTASW